MPNIYEAGMIQSVLIPISSPKAMLIAKLTLDNPAIKVPLSVEKGTNNAIKKITNNGATTRFAVF